MTYSVYLRTSMELHGKTTVAVHGGTIRKDRRGVTVITEKSRYFVPWDNVAYTLEDR